jgi:hypothetical protein
MKFRVDRIGFHKTAHREKECNVTNIPDIIKVSQLLLLNFVRNILHVTVSMQCNMRKSVSSHGIQDLY